MRIGTDGGMGIKPSDEFTLPLCGFCHRQQHLMGERTFWAERGIAGVVALVLADDLWAHSGDIKAGEKIVYQFRRKIALGET